MVALRAIAICFASGILSACGTTSAIQPVASSKSQFDSGEVAVIATAAPGEEEFRVFERGASGFVPVSALRSDEEERATEFCKRQAKAMKPLREIASKPPHVLGNFPRLELVFTCAEPPATAEDPRYAKIASLKQLLDSGALTREEFEREKTKILGTQ